MCAGIASQKICVCHINGTSKLISFELYQRNPYISNFAKRKHHTYSCRASMIPSSWNDSKRVVKKETLKQEKLSKEKETRTIKTLKSIKDLINWQIEKKKKKINCHTWTVLTFCCKWLNLCRTKLVTPLKIEGLSKGGVPRGPSTVGGLTWRMHFLSRRNK